ncbi:carboxymuconolactone decarboxylase family protein [Opitutus terrae]|uniref:Alkylhydroperoxidase like protein, AhpD family n=1 Tax=Opitutus terrae (strain DSM 11246 / JCM 15787 / PB90-1) TaxID=452637 RepID=B1ZXK9_OPITP|nr:carboxymuconolactone decarboxylase family protein [Opitutus terrae]ACB77004.1 alkylhydroperoxidase like protein, AhpD family [Opitutus terrae PB90-1]
MEERLNYAEASPQGFKAILGLERHVRESNLEHRLLELVKTRASQLNGCAFCLDMHTKDARAAGETEQRLYALSAWRETPFFDERERAALAWTEAVTQLHPQHPIPDAVYAEVRPHFNDRDLVDLTLAIIAINGWNRLAIAFRKTPGSYQPPSTAPAAVTAKA